MLKYFNGIIISTYFVLPSAGVTQVNDHVKMRLTSQLINDIPKVLQKVLKYFDGIIISTSFVLPSAGVFLVVILDLNDSEAAKL